MTQTYCTRDDLEAIWPPAELLASVDDDTSGTLSATEESYLTRGIERAANLMNARLETRYVLTSLATNAWCRDANAAIAAFLLATRRGDPAPAHLQQQYDTYLADLGQIASGHLKVPGAAESHDAGPGVVNFAIQIGEP
ncbi:MAG: phage protein Gp36 family protein [Pirellulaceae bacterium]|nr:phage protein Gp36 family protein [Pirellulaceae bacterium]